MGAIRDTMDEAAGDGGSNDGDGAICNSWCWKGSMIVRRIISVPLTIVDVAGTWCFFGSVVPVEEEPSSSSSLSEDEPTSNNEDDDGIGGRLRRWLQQQQQQQQQQEQQQQQQIPRTYFDEYGPALLVFAILSTVVLLAVFALFLVQYQYSKQEEEQQDDANSNADDGVDEGGEKGDNDKGDDDDDEKPPVDNGTFHTIKNNIRKYARTGKRLYWAQVLVVSLPQFILTSPYVVRQGVTGWALFNYISSGMNSVDKIHKVYRSCCE